MSMTNLNQRAGSQEPPDQEAREALHVFTVCMAFMGPHVNGEVTELPVMVEPAFRWALNVLQKRFVLYCDAKELQSAV